MNILLGKLITPRRNLPMSKSPKLLQKMSVYRKRNCQHSYLHLSLGEESSFNPRHAVFSTFTSEWISTCLTFSHFHWILESCYKHLAFYHMPVAQPIREKVCFG
uniref:Uncharacterized protein n=1 Tax=Micrurus spixii TaxID=129469 RepID=A0A2D4MG86_9SAUR